MFNQQMWQIRHVADVVRRCVLWDVAFVIAFLAGAFHISRIGLAPFHFVPRLWADDYHTFALADISLDTHPAAELAAYFASLTFATALLAMHALAYLVPTPLREIEFSAVTARIQSSRVPRWKSTTGVVLFVTTPVICAKPAQPLQVAKALALFHESHLAYFALLAAMFYGSGSILLKLLAWGFWRLADHSTAQGTR